MVISIREALPAEILAFADMETAEGTAEFIIPYPLSKHYAELSKSDVQYLAVLTDEKLVGFMILRLDPDGVSVELRRIVVATPGKGIGQAAIVAMECHCKQQLIRQRIWLDVFEFNQRGRHIYEKLGYGKFGQREYYGQMLLLYEKVLR